MRPHTHTHCKQSKRQGNYTMPHAAPQSKRGSSLQGGAVSRGKGRPEVSRSKRAPTNTSASFCSLIVVPFPRTTHPRDLPPLRLRRARMARRRMRRRMHVPWSHPRLFLCITTLPPSRHHLHQPSSSTDVLLHPHLAEIPKIGASASLHFLIRPSAIMHLP